MKWELPLPDEFDTNAIQVALDIVSRRDVDREKATLVACNLAGFAGRTIWVNAAQPSVIFGSAPEPTEEELNAALAAMNAGTQQFSPTLIIGIITLIFKFLVK